MIYACEDCGFLFCRRSEIQQCPFCDGRHIRPATPEESKNLQKHLEMNELLVKE